MKKFLILLLALLLIGCGSSKKKIAQKSETNTEQTTETKEKTTEKTEKETASSESDSSKSTEKKQDESFTGEVNDPSKPAVITKETKDGKEVTTYENFKSVNHKKENSESESNKDSEKKTFENESTEKEIVREETTKAKSADKKSDTEMIRDQGFKLPWWGWLLGIGYVVISIWRKNIRPWKWL